MIQPLRNVHRYVFSGLAVLLPVIFLGGLGARHPRRPASIEAQQLPASATLVFTSDNLWKKHAMRSEFYRDESHPRDVYVMLRPMQDPGEPDLLLYWSTDEGQQDTLPTGGRLLGSFIADKVFALPQDTKPAGQLILYSLAHQATVDTATVERLP